MPETTYGYENQTAAFIDQAGDAIKKGKESLSNMASALKDKTQEFGRATAEQMEANRASAAGALHSTADTIHGNANRLPNGPEIAHSTAKRVDAMAGYLDDHDTRQMMSDAGRIVRRNPVPSLVIAACIGYLVGRSVRG